MKKYFNGFTKQLLVVTAVTLTIITSHIHAVDVTISGYSTTPANYKLEDSDTGSFDIDANGKIILHVGQSLYLSVGSKAYDDAYKQAYDAAIAAGKTPTEAALLAADAGRIAAEAAALAAGATPEEAAKIAQGLTPEGAAEQARKDAELRAPAQGDFIGGISDANEIVFYDHDTKLWKDMPDDIAFDDIPGSIPTISINNLGHGWAANNVKQVLFRDGLDKDDDWEMVDGSLSQVVVNNNDMVWGVNDATLSVYVREGITTEKPMGTSWTQVTDGQLMFIAINDANQVYGVDKDGVVVYRVGITPSNPKGSQWIQIPGQTFKAIALDKNGHLWGIDQSGVMQGVSPADQAGKIYFREGITAENPTGTNWQVVEGTLKSLDVSNEGDIWGVDGSGRIFTREASATEPMGKSWVEVDGKLKSIFVSGFALSGPVVANLPAAEIPLATDTPAEVTKKLTIATNKKKERKAKRDKTNPPHVRKANKEKKKSRKKSKS